MLLPMAKAFCVYKGETVAVHDFCPCEGGIKLIRIFIMQWKNLSAISKRIPG